ncbi:MAG TPA: hypothetical protein VGM11_09610 [Acidobacteriaceae bacterium]|jgi:hypothetical protein
MDTRRVPEHHAIEPHPPSTAPGPGQPRVEPRRLWFGFASSAICWIALGILDMLITWRACIYQEEYGLPSHPTSATVLYLTASVLLLAITIAAGITSYRNWQSIAQQRTLLESPAVDRTEFMAVIGVIISITLGVGIVLLALPPLFLSLCWRAR